MTEENPKLVLEKRIRFLLPPIVAVGLIIGLAFMAADLWAIHQPLGRVSLAFLELLLVLNILIRRRCQVQLKRLTAGCCMTCGYDLRGSVDRCRECGAISPKAPES